MQRAYLSCASAPRSACWARALRGASAAILVAAWALLAAGARADAPLPPREVPLFTIAKSENKNQVQYAIQVDEHCGSASSAPVFAYWRMLEKGPDRTEPLLPRELDAYGIASQSVVSREPEGGKVRMVLRAVRSRPILIETWQSGSGCQAVATLSINGTPAHLFNVYAKLKWFFGVDYLLLQGWSMDGARVVREKLGG
jgi:hypothetical protein